MPARIRAEWGSNRERSELEDEQRDSTSPLADVNSSGGPVRARSFRDGDHQRRSLGSGGGNLKPSDGHARHFAHQMMPVAFRHGRTLCAVASRRERARE